MEMDDKIIVEKLKRLTSMEPKTMIHRVLRRDYKVDRLVAKYKWRYLTNKVEVV